MDDRLVSARRIITGVEIEGEISDGVLATALEVMDRLSTGGVSGAQDLEADGVIKVSFRNLSRHCSIAELKGPQEVALVCLGRGIASPPHL